MAKKGGIVWYMNDLDTGMQEFPAKLHLGIQATMEYYSDRATSYMKSNASWTDRTGNARNTLNSKAFSSPTEHTIVLYHQMPYGIWLEVRYSGRYAIILPTVEHFGPEVMDTLNKLIARLL